MPIRGFATTPANEREWGKFFRQTTVTADVVSPNTVDTAMIVDGAVTNAKLRDSGPLSIIGRPVNSPGDPSDIAAAVDLTLLRRSGAVIGFGTVTSAYVSDFNEACQDAALSALTDSSEIDWTYNDGAGTASAAIILNSITNTLLRDSSALSVIGRSANSTGDPGDLTGTADQVLRVNSAGTVLGFGTIATLGITDDAVTNPKLANMAQDTIKGRTSGAGTGDPVDLTAAQVATIISSAIASSLNITEGTYTPTLDNTVNITASTANVSAYLRVLNRVIVVGFATVDPTAAGTVELGISLPIASNFGANTDLVGNASALAVAGQSAGIVADVTNDRARLIWVTVDTGNNNMFYVFMYRVI